MKKLLILLIFTMLITFSFSAAAEDPVTLWAGNLINDMQHGGNLVELFESGNPVDTASDYGPTLQSKRAQQFTIQAKSGNPDNILLLFEYFTSFADAGYLMPVNDVFNELEDKDQYYDNVIEALTIDGNLYAIPSVVNVRLLLYRKSILEKHGLEVPTTWEELIETSKYISENEPGMEGFMLTTKEGDVRSTQEFTSFYLQLNKNMFNVGEDETTVAATPEQFAEVLSLYDNVFSFVDENKKGSSWKQLDYGYTSGEFAMIQCGPWISFHQDEPDRAKVLEDTGVIALPVAANGEPATFMAIKSYAINKYTDQPEKAEELLKYLTSKRMQEGYVKYVGNVSARKDIAEDEEVSGPITAEFGKYLGTGVPLDPVKWAQPQEKISRAIQYVVYDQQTPEEAGQWLYDELVGIAETW